jgi:lipopolysaccharide/colanic/teichoic acid biosynthesis glycosyltransferase
MQNSNQDKKPSKRKLSQKEAFLSNLTAVDSNFQPVSVRNPWGYGFFKRAFDIFNSLLAIILLSPLMLIIGLLVVTTSRGPMIYVSDRIGRYGRPFKFYKFRSMQKGADKRLVEFQKYNEMDGGVMFKMKDDPRVTRFGRFLRKTSLDELPQLFNILNGDMSFVGPRPGLPWEKEKYDNRALCRLLVPQGLTGEWQTHGRSNTTFPQMINMDLEYVQKKRGFWYDLGLIFRTLVVVLKHDGAE